MLAYGWSSSAPAQTKKERNSASQRYEINQAFDGSVYHKDNNVWVCTREFAELFGMPKQFIGNVKGVAAAAFRIESKSYQACGYGGKANACRMVDACVLDLYFDESKTPLPWATDIKSQWVPSNSSMYWLRLPNSRVERPYGKLSIDSSPEVIRNKLLPDAIVAFADPVTKVESKFTTNANAGKGGPESVSDALPLRGYMRDFYRNLSVVSLNFGCGRLDRKDVNIRLDALRKSPFKYESRSHRLYLPPAFVQQMNGKMTEHSEKNAIFYRSLFKPPLGTNAE